MCLEWTLVSCRRLASEESCAAVPASRDHNNLIIYWSIRSITIYNLLQSLGFHGDQLRYSGMMLCQRLRVRAWITAVLHKTVLLRSSKLSSSECGRREFHSCCRPTPSLGQVNVSEQIQLFYIPIIPVLGFLDLILNPKTAGQSLNASARA